MTDQSFAPHQGHSVLGCRVNTLNGNMKGRFLKKWFPKWSGHYSGLAKTILQDTAKGGKKTRQTEKEVGRQHQGMVRPGEHKVPEGIGEQGKMEATGCEAFGGAPTTLADKG